MYLQSLCTISTLWLLDGLTQSPLEAVPVDLLWEGLEASLAGRQLLTLWEEGVQNSLCPFTTLWDGVSSLDFVGVSKHLLRAINQALLAVYGSLSDSSELLLVTPLVFSNLALAHLGGTLLIMGGSEVEVLLICDVYWSMLAASVFCCWKRLLVTALLSMMRPSSSGRHPVRFWSQMASSWTSTFPCVVCVDHQ